MAADKKYEELDYIVEKLIPIITDRLGLNAQGVGDIEIVSSMDGINTLPALKKVGGVEKIVEAPVSLLSKPIDDAVKECEDASQDAREQAAVAKATASDVNVSKKLAQDAAQEAREAAASVDASKLAALTAAGDARTAAGLAEDKGNIAEQKGILADQKAALASQKAAYAQEKGDFANQKGIYAEQKADIAERSALNANTATQEARKEKEATAKVKDETSAIAAHTASTNAAAEAEIEKMKVLQQSITAEASLSPSKMELTYLKEICTMNRVPQKIRVRLYPTFALQNYLFLPGGGESISVEPDGSLTVNKIGATRIHVIPTGATGIYQTITINVRGPKMRLTGNGKIRLSNGKIRLI